jgi:hypothetical protein
MTSALAHRLAEAIDQSICEQVDRETVKAWFGSVSSEMVAVACINALAEQMADQGFVHPARWLKEQGQ